MAHRHRVRDIADQAGLSEATVDRVLHHRPGVSVRATRAVHRAIADLDRQAGQLVLTGRSLVADLVMAAPERFTTVVLAAFESEAAMLRPALVRLRYDVAESVDLEQMARRLERLARRGSDGVLLKAPDVPVVAQAVDALLAAGIPVITLVTDLPTTARHAYVGVDNAAAGATAAYVLDLVLGEGPGDVLVPLSRAAFLGEEQRAVGFEAELARVRPSASVVRIEGTDGLDATMRSLAAVALSANPGVTAVYSPGGANRGTLAAFADVDRPVRGFVAHDLDEDNVALLREGRLTAVLHHDLRRDARRALRGLLQVQGLLPGRPVSVPSPIVVVTPHNLPT